MTRVIIHRPLWFRGNGSDNSRLLGDQAENGHQKMCCLGFACLALGASEDEIRGKTYPSATKRKLPGLTEDRSDEYPGYVGLVRADTEFATKAAKINDGHVVGHNSKAIEEALTKLAKENGFEFVFVG